MIRSYAYWLMFLLATVAGMPVHAAGFSYVAPSSDHPVEIGIWYPTETQAPSAPNTLFRQALAIDAEPVGKALPLIILSHGNGGWMGGHADTALALAESGYVAAAITHSDDNYNNQDVSPAKWMVSRPREVVSSINFLLEHWSGAKHVSRQRIGVFGFSAGGYTALVAAGGIPDLDLAIRHCEQAPMEYTCKTGLVGKMAGSGPGGDLPVFASDSRIKAISIAAPGFGFAFDAKALESIEIPVQIWSAELDKSVSHATNGQLIADGLSGESVIEIVEGAGHFAFLKPCNREQKKAKPRICKDAPGFDRIEFHRLLNEKIVAFFDKMLAR